MATQWMNSAVAITAARTLAARALAKTLCLLVSLTSLQALADVDAGKAVFNQCSGCHAVGPGAAHRFGPQLNGIMSRGAATVADFDYSEALSSRAESGLVWDESTLSAAEERQQVIHYLASINAAGSTQGSEALDNTSVTGTPITETESRPLARDTSIPEHGILHLGRPALSEEVSAWDIDIRPDGLGLPQGSGTVEAGGELYDAQCASCHGVFGEGEGRWPVLAGGQESLTDERPEKTIGSYWPYLSTVFDYVRRAMPFGNSRSLSDDDIYALTAYLLYLNDVVDDSFELTSDNLASIRLPNQDNFIADNRAEEPWFGSDSEPCMSQCREGEAQVTQRARVLDVTPDAEGDEAGGSLD